MSADSERLTKAEKKALEQNNRLRESCLRGVDQVYQHPICREVWECMDICYQHKDHLLTIPNIYSQLSRALSSVLANYAEGIGKADVQDELRFLKIARGSAYEAHVHAVGCLCIDLAHKVKSLCFTIDRLILDKLAENSS